MSESLFDDESAPFLILINHQRQYSIWPEIVPIPSGWEVAQSARSRQHCMEWLEHNWTDLRPYSLHEKEGVTA
jgi:MbtH protein